MISTVLEYCTLQFRHQFRVFVVPDQLSAVTAVHRFKSTADSPVFVVTVWYIWKAKSLGPTKGPTTYTCEKAASEVRHVTTIDIWSLVNRKSHGISGVTIKSAWHSTAHHHPPSEGVLGSHAGNAV